MAIWAFCMLFEIFASGTMMRFSSYGFAMSRPSASRMRDCWARGDTVNSLGRSLKKSTPPLAACPVAPTAGIASPAISSPATVLSTTKPQQEPEHGGDILGATVHWPRVTRADGIPRAPPRGRGPSPAELPRA